MSGHHGSAPPPRQILVVDDDPDFLGLMARFLTQEGYAVALAASSAEAEAMLSASRPAVIIADLWLTNARDLALVDRLATMPEAAGIPILLCTAAIDRLEEATVRLGERPVAVLLKPFDLDDCLASLARLL